MTNDMVILSELRCESCHEPHGGKIGDPCDEACEHSRLVKAFEVGRYCVEISEHQGEFKATGLIGENLSREFGVRDYKRYSFAEYGALNWLKKKCSES